MVALHASVLRRKLGLEKLKRITHESTAASHPKSMCFPDRVLGETYSTGHVKQALSPIRHQLVIPHNVHATTAMPIQSLL